jgi:hypothetical protein
LTSADRAVLFINVANSTSESPTKMSASFEQTTEEKSGTIGICQLVIETGQFPVQRNKVLLQLSRFRVFFPIPKFDQRQPTIVEWIDDHNGQKAYY